MHCGALDQCPVPAAGSPAGAVASSRPALLELRGRKLAGRRARQGTGDLFFEAHKPNRIIARHHRPSPRRITASASRLCVFGSSTQLRSEDLGRPGVARARAHSASLSASDAVAGLARRRAAFFLDPLSLAIVQTPRATVISLHGALQSNGAARRGGLDQARRRHWTARGRDLYKICPSFLSGCSARAKLKL